MLPETLRWKVYYIDGRTFSNIDGNPEDAPGSGVAAVVQEDKVVGTAIHSGNTFYIFGEQYGGWYGADEWGLSQYLARPGLKVIKLAETMITDKFLELRKKIQADPELPNKSAHYPWERYST